MIRGLKKHYHWVIAFLAFLEMVLYGGLLNSASVFIIPISESLNVSRASFASASIPYNLVCSIGTMLSGTMFHRFGYKKCAIVSLVIVAASYVMTAFSTNLTVYMISKVIFGLGYAACFTAGAVRIVKDWFFKHQGLVVGAVTMSSGLGGALMTILLTDIMERSDWRTANLVVAGMVAAMTVIYLLIKDKPEQLGLKPFGYGEIPKKVSKKNTIRTNWIGYDTKELLRHPLFYLMNICTLASCVCIYVACTVVVPHFQAQGFTVAEAAGMQSFIMLVVGIAKLICGGLCDRLGSKPVTVFCMICAVVGQWMMSVSPDPLLCYAGCFLLSIGMCMTSLMVPLLAQELFGYKSSLGANGVFMAMCSLASMISGPISNYCFDTTGSYVLAFRIAAVVNVGVLILYFVLFAQAKREKSRYLAAHPENQ